jgi:hypothetical protein
MSLSSEIISGGCSFFSKVSTFLISRRCGTYRTLKLEKTNFVRQFRFRKLISECNTGMVPIKIYYLPFLDLSDWREEGGRFEKEKKRL